MEGAGDNAKMVDLQMILTGLLGQYTNKREIRVIGIVRSGHHAVINWIMKQLKGKVVFLNKCKSKKNPFKSCNRYVSLPADINIEEERKGKFSKKDCLVYSYEGYSLDEIQNKFSLDNHDKWVGRSLKKNDILVLRDPFNMFASWLKREPHIEKFLGQKIILWKTYAKEYLGRGDNLLNAINVNYNIWVSDKQYRVNLSKKLGLEFSDEGIKILSKWGSSFDGRRFKGRAHEMKVLERWKHMADNSIYRKIFSDKELLELSDEIFGKIPGTEVLL